MKRMRRTSLILLMCGLVLGGLVWARFVPALPTWSPFIPVVGAILLSRRFKLLSLYLVLAAAFCMGWWRGGLTMQLLKQNQQLVGRKITVIGTAETDTVYDTHSQLSFDIQHASADGQPLAGTIAVSGFGGYDIKRGDRVEAAGKLYPSRGSHTFRVSFAQLNVVHSASVPLDTVRKRFNAGAYSALPEPLASFSLGLLIGQRSTMPAALLTTLSVVGLTHIVAVSGYNLTIIISGVKRLRIARSKFQLFCLSLVLIGSFMLITGFSASIVRAAFVSLLALLGWYYGRRMRPLMVVLLPAAVTALWNPLYLWSDIGWYLSFLAFFGIIIVAPLVAARLARPGKDLHPIALIFVETLCAQVMAMPIIMYIFGQFSVVGLIANLLVVPFVPVAMLLSFVAGLAGMLVPMISGWFALPARFVLTYMLDVVNMLSHISHASVAVSLSVGAMGVLYACVLLACLLLWHRKPKTDKITEVIITKARPIHERTLQMVND